MLNITKTIKLKQLFPPPLNQQRLTMASTTILHWGTVRPAGDGSEWQQR